jgi:hypothetical protein
MPIRGQRIVHDKGDDDSFEDMAHSYRESNMTREFSPAAMPLPENLVHSKAETSGHHGRKSCRITDSRNSGYNTQNTPQSDGNLTDFELVKHVNAVQSSRDILERYKAREVIRKNLGRNTPSGHMDYDHREVNVQDQNIPFLDNPTITPLASPFSEPFSVALGNDPTVSPVQDVFSQQPVDCSHKNERSNKGKFSKTCQRALVELALAPITVTIDLPPVVPHQQLDLPATETTSPKLPSASSYDLSISPISNVVDISPINVAKRSWMTLAAANAIIYCCTTFMTMRFAILSLGGDVSAAELVQDIGAGFIAGAIVCILFHWVQGGRVQRVPGDMLQTVALSLRKTWGFLVNGFEEGR